ncbi:MAG: hypothetical protein ACI31M_01715 [Bacilli bacterium]
MTLVDHFRLLVGGYYGVLEMEEFNTNSYILKQIEDYIRDFLATNPINNFDYLEEARVLSDLPLKRKLQDSLIVLNKICGPLELILLIKKRLKEIEQDSI